MTDIVLTELTTGSPTGGGVFDKMLSSMRAHLEIEFNKGRIKGPEFATVYLGSLETVMASSMNFVMQRRSIALQADLLEQQIILAGIEVQKANIALEIMAIEKLKADATLSQITAQTALLGQQKNNLEAEALNIPKQGMLIDKQAAVAGQQVINLTSENSGILARNANTIAEGLNIPKQGEVLDAQVCKLQAEFDLTVNTNTKTTGEIALLAQKTATEKAQTQQVGVDDNSVVGKQKQLYQAQTDGFARDAEQKAASLLVQTWSVRRTSDEGTVADSTNMLNDATIGRVVNKVLVGVGA